MEGDNKRSGVSEVTTVEASLHIRDRISLSLDQNVGYSVFFFRYMDGNLPGFHESLKMHGQYGVFENYTNSMHSHLRCSRLPRISFSSYDTDK